MILESLIEATRLHPNSRKRLVGPDVNYGRELLVALARQTGGWIGWEATSLRGIAEDLAFVPLAEAGVRAATDIEIESHVNSAIDEVLAARGAERDEATLEQTLGFRRAIRDALLQLRTAGVNAQTLRRDVENDSPARDLPSILECYERSLVEARLVDPAGLFSCALEAFDREAPFTLDGFIFFAPTLEARGLPGQLADRLTAHGAHLLAGDTPVGLVVPASLLAGRPVSHRPTLVGDSETRSGALAWIESRDIPSETDARLDRSACEIDIFAAATPSSELREVCRRIIAEGLRWDDVEIVSTDVDAYGIALDALGQLAGIGATMLQGIPFTRTRLGGALQRWFGWLADGLPADALRQALEAGELASRDPAVASSALARELRLLDLGWGRARYAEAVSRITAGDWPPERGTRDDESEDDRARRLEDRRAAAKALGTLITALLDAAPHTPERGAEEVTNSTCAELAGATLIWMEHVPLVESAEERTAERLRNRLRRLADTDVTPASFGSALATLRESLADLRAWPPVSGERKPWSAAGGMLHLTDIAHAGTTGRGRSFVVGLDAGRTAGSRQQDPFLPDALKSRLASAALPTVAERRELSRYQLASSLGALRGRVTLSYSMNGGSDERAVTPSPLLLQSFRITHRDAKLSYEDLRKVLMPPVSPVLARSSDGASNAAQLLDARDVWLDALADGSLLLDGDLLIGHAFPDLAAGLRAASVYSYSALTPFHGIVAAGRVPDPTGDQAPPVSPSALETLSGCPLRWFYKYVLLLRAPDEAEYDPEIWLTESDRGNLLHAIFEKFVKEYRGHQQAIHEAGAEEKIRSIAELEIQAWRSKVPPPGELVYAAEVTELHQAASAFLQLERQLALAGNGGHWAEVEMAVGSRRNPVAYRVDERTVLPLFGRTDRVDELTNGTLRAIDYKTGRPERFAKTGQEGPFGGGRHLQPTLYHSAVATVLGREVSGFEYRFPTGRGQNQVISYSAAELDAARPIIGDLIASVRAGAFLPTNDRNDCRYCDFKPICRGNDKSAPPRVEWAERHAAETPEYRAMIARRSPEDA